MVDNTKRRICGIASAGSDPMHTAAIGFRLSIAKLLVPFMFVYTPALLFIEFEPFAFTIALMSGILSIMFIATGFTGFFVQVIGKFQRTVLLIFGVSLIFGSSIMLLTAGGIGVIILALNTRSSRIRPVDSGTA